MGDGTVRCWGSDRYGELGMGRTTEGAQRCVAFENGGEGGDPEQFTCRSTPTPVPGLEGVVDLAAGEYHTCALSRGGAVHSWGFNRAGQLGDGTTTDRALPNRGCVLTS
jgi:alpha-tubulin suppressor-like RCC1 family protein